MELDHGSFRYSGQIVLPRFRVAGCGCNIGASKSQLHVGIVSIWDFDCRPWCLGLSVEHVGFMTGSHSEHWDSRIPC